MSVSFKLPSVIRLLRFVKIKRRFDYVPFSRANIYARDNHTCQYCSETLPTSELTFDHVVPVAHGGRKDWENIVTCCVGCNRKKGAVRPPRPACACSGIRGGPIRRRPFASRSDSATRRKAGATTCTGTWSWTKVRLTDVPPVVTSVVPARAVGRGRVTINGSNFDIGDSCEVLLRDVPARISFASSRRIVITIPDEMDGGRAPVLLGDTTLGHVSIGSIWATGLHQVDNPVFDRGGNLFVTSQWIARAGIAGLDLPRHARGTREPFSSGIVNATSMAIGPDGKLYVSSRFEGPSTASPPTGHLSRSRPISESPAASRSMTRDGCSSATVQGTIFRVRDGRASAFAMLPASVAAFHLAMSPAGELHVTAPTLGTYDPIYKIDTRGQITTIASSLGRPQGSRLVPTAS